MEQIKVFEYIPGENQEGTINEWYKENDGKIEVIKRQALGGSRMTKIVIFYKTVDTSKETL